MNLAGLLHRAAGADPDRPALAVGPHIQCSYVQLAHRVAGVAGALRRHFAHLILPIEKRRSAL